MQRLIDEFDWAATPIGPRASWPQSLRTSVSICLASRFPILIWWGPELIKLYNDAYASIIGTKHPHALGAPGREVWPEIWPVISPMLDQVRQEGKATWSDDQLLLIRRHGFTEECYFCFSYSPILDETGGVGGIFTAVIETTSRVISQRRLNTLRQLAARASEAASFEEACSNAIEILGRNPHDIPFAAIHLRNDGGTRVLCAAGDESAASPDRIIELPLGDCGEAVLVAAFSDRLPIDDDYRSFFSFVAGHISSAITKAKAYEAERRRAEALAELDRAKTAFFSNVSHEFRTPLTLMLGPLEDLLAVDGPLDTGTREQLDVVHRNALRLLKLVNNLLDFSRIEAGRIEASFEPVDLAALTTDLAGLFRSAVERAGLRLVVDCPPLTQPVYVDRHLWEKVVLNLLSNAFKFTFEGEITVSLRENGGHAELTVRDTGAGIPAAELPHVFDRFHRVEGARGRTHEGSGIGLALVHELAHLHGGSVGVVSEVDRGSAFTVSIPLGTAHLPAEHIEAQQPDPPTAVRGDAFAEEALRWLPQTTDDVAAAGRDGARIVIADDNADMRRYLARLLGSRYAVEVVADGRAALEAAERETPELVLADVMMPEMDGFELLRALRADERTSSVPVLLLSARAGEESRVEGLDAGADDYLVKPFHARELLARVESHIRLNRVRRNARRKLQASEARFATAFARSPVPLIITALDDERLIDVNDAFLEFFGGTREEIAISREMLAIDREAGRRRLEQLRSTGAAPEMEARVRTKSGQERVMLVSSAVVDIDGRPAVLSSLLDITDRKRAEDEMRVSEERFREFADNAPAMLWITDRDGRFSFLSRTWYEFSGQSEEEALGFGWIDALHPDDREASLATMLTANARREPFELDHRVRHVDGAYRWVSASGRPRFKSGTEFAGFIGSLIDITDRKHAEQAKDQFLASLSHELRTPLTSGFGWARLLTRTQDKELMEAGLRAIDESFVNQMRLVDDLLDISRIAAGKLHLEVQALDLRSIVEAAVEMVRPSAAAKQINLRANLASVLLVRGDSSRLHQVFWNLLSNAIKFTPAGGAVDVELRRRNENAEIVVRDEGEGIRREFLPHVFDRFRQADATTTRKHGGLGIGLSIVSSLVDAHRGSVRAESDGPGRGATFTVMLPLIDQHSAFTPSMPRPAQRDQDALDGTRILVVDDDDSARQIVTTTLLSAGAEVRSCTNAGDAYDAVEEWRPDMLVSDVAMPGEDGYTLIRRLRESGNRVPALAITAYARPEDEARVIQAGFQRHVAKPFDPTELVKVLRELRS